MSFPIDQSRDSSSPEHQQLRGGQRVFNGRYELREKLGAGGMGVVWLAYDQNEKALVALKFLPTILIQHDKEMDTLRDQVRVGKELLHPLIVATYGLEMVGSLAAIVLEYVPGETLKQKIEASEDGFLEPAVIHGWLRDVVSALSYLHEDKKRLHRDLKPANIIVDAEGYARLLDFGISHSLKETMGRHSQTGQSHGTSNTLAYASPESLRPRHKPAVADDIYGLGATLYELLTGTPPFYQGGPEVIALHVKTEPVPSIAQRREDLLEDGANNTVGEPVPELWEQAVALCLRKEAAGRPAKASDVLTLLSPAPEIVIAKESLPAKSVPPPPTPRPTPQPRPRQTKRPSFFILGAITILVASIATFALWPKGTPKATTPDIQQPTPPQPKPVPAATPTAPKAAPVSPIDDGTVGKVISFTLPGGEVMKFCYCPPGSFTMGSPTTEAERSASEDQVPVQLTHGYWMAQTECTQGQWEALMGSNPSNFTGSKKLPVEQVSWEEAQQLIAKLNETVQLPAGWTFALPTEAQWEYACRADSTTAFAFGDTLTSTQANFLGYSPYGLTTPGPNLEKTTDAASYAANAWGLYDMHGNVWEWCLDARDEETKLIGGTDPESKVGSYRVSRGGSWLDSGWVCRSAFRGRDHPAIRNLNLGLRVAVVPTGSVALQPTPTPPPPTPTAPTAAPVSPIDDGTVGKILSFPLPGGEVMKFCYCPPGSFTMGSPITEEGRQDNEDQVPVQLTHGYWMAQTECTQGQWEALMGSNPSNFKGSKKLPVEMVSWEEAQQLITKINETVQLAAGWTFALPTEAQWEYACRAGTTTAFAFGNTLNSTQANFNGNYPYVSTTTGLNREATTGPNLEKTTNAASYQANAWGLFDTHGNVWEWCRDAWDGKTKLIGGSDPESKVGSLRVNRGGSWFDYGRYCRSAYRGRNGPALLYDNLGFRVAVVPTESK